MERMGVSVSGALGMYGPPVQIDFMGQKFDPLRKDPCLSIL